MHRLVILAVMLLVMAGCQSDAGGGTSSGLNGGQQTVDGVSVSLIATNLSSGQTILEITVLDADGKAVPVENFTVRGDMTHAGMSPIITSIAALDVDTVVPGRYNIPFMWTMGGDWIITVTTKLLSGAIIEHEFPFSVGS
jgi:hypothetical protein